MYNDMPATQQYHLITPERKPEFVERGYKGRYFFPHQVYYLPRPLPEQVATARRFWGLHDPDALYCVLLYASDEMAGQLPEELFFDPQVMIHNEHMGRPGLVATAHLYIDGDTLCTDEHQSDLVQRIANRREHKSWVEKRFGTWHHMLLNSILNFAVLKDLREIRIPIAQRVVEKYLDIGVNSDLFERLYDRNVELHFKAQRQDDFWLINVAQHREKLIPLSRMAEPTSVPKRSACIVHDIGAALQGSADLAQHLEPILSAEADAGVRATYSVPGMRLDAVRAPIQQGGHAIAMRSFDNTPYRYPARRSNDESPAMAALTRLYRRVNYTLQKRFSMQAGNTPTATAIRTACLNKARRVLGLTIVSDTLSLCRDADYYAKGYRQTPQDTDAGLTDDLLAYYHFEWVITDDDDADPTRRPTYQRGLMKLPITLTFDGPAQGGDVSAWMGRLDEAVAADGMTTIHLPCDSAPQWLPHYPAMLEKLQQHSEIQTIQDVCNAYHFSRSV